MKTVPVNITQLISALFKEAQRLKDEDAANPEISVLCTRMRELLESIKDVPARERFFGKGSIDIDVLFARVAELEAVRG